MIISIVLTHNKGDKGNEQQIADMLAMVIDHESDDRASGHYYTLKDIPEHEVKFLHIVPFGVERPSNMDQLDGHKVLYGAGDEDKTGDHPRFYNWGLKRGTDLGGEVVLHVDDVQLFSPKQIHRKLERLVNKEDRLNFTEEEFGKASSVELLRQVGQVKEDATDPLGSFKQRIVSRGLIHG